MTTPSMFARYVASTPTKAAALAVRGLRPGADERDRERAEAVAVELRRADRCARCGRELRNRVSREHGIGPECRRQIGADPAARAEVRAVLEVLAGAGFPTLPLDELEDGLDLPQETP